MYNASDEPHDHDDCWKHDPHILGAAAVRLETQCSMPAHAAAPKWCGRLFLGVSGDGEEVVEEELQRIHGGRCPLYRIEVHANYTA